MAFAGETHYFAKQIPGLRLLFEDRARLVSRTDANQAMSVQQLSRDSRARIRIAY
jgi:hypothetical protein